MSAIPIGKPYSSPRPRSQTRSTMDLFNAVVARGAVFSTIAGFVFLSSSLAGHVMVEKARRESIRSLGRATAARQSLQVLQGQVESIRNPDAIAEWAKLNGFVTVEELVAPKEAQLVASR